MLNSFILSLFMLHTPDMQAVGSLPFYCVPYTIIMYTSR